MFNLSSKNILKTLSSSRERSSISGSGSLFRITILQRSTFMRNATWDFVWMTTHWTTSTIDLFTSLITPFRSTIKPRKICLRIVCGKWTGSQRLLANKNGKWSKRKLETLLFGVLKVAKGMWQAKKDHVKWLVSISWSTICSTPG